MNIPIIIVDKDIPFIKGFLESYFHVIYAEGEMTYDQVKNADALIIRTRTICNRDLLEKDGELSTVKFIASATIGIDHLDIDYLKSRNIEFTYAAGCNAGGVMQYVFTALYALAEYGKRPFSLKNKTLGVIGDGNTGSRVAALGEYLGFRVLRNDPPKAIEELVLDGAESKYSDLNYLIENSDIISLHIPLNEDTNGLISESFLRKAKKDLILINSSRGGVVNDEAVINTDLRGLILDVWNGEPDNISRDLLLKADIISPHIAGYSKEGKINGTKAVLSSIGVFFGIRELETIKLEEEEEKLVVNLYGKTQKEIADTLLEIFPLFDLDKKLREDPENFEKIRKKYHYRKEFFWINNINL